MSVPASAVRQAHPERAWPGAVVAALAVALYIPSLLNGWTGDDRAMMYDNPIVRDVARLGSAFTTEYWAFLGQVPHVHYRPLVIASMGLQRAVAGDHPWSFRLVDALLHGLAAWLLWALLRRRLAIPALAATLAALLFAVHPAGSEAVLLVVGRADVLVAIATLAALYLHLSDEPSTLRRHVLLPGVVILALCAKESAVAIPPLLLIVDAVRGRLRQNLGLHAATFAVMLGFWFGIRGRVLAGAELVEPGLQNPLYGLGFFARLPGVLGVLGRYVMLTLAPVHLSADYSYNVVPAQPPWTAPSVILGLVATLASAAAVLAARRAPRVAIPLALSLFWLPLFPVSNLVVRVWAIFGERFLYVPLLGAAVLAAVALRRFDRLIPVAGVVVLLFAGRTVWREYDWRDPMTLAARTAAGSQSAKAHYDYSLALADAKRPADEEAECRAALAIDPGYFPALVDLGNLLLGARRLEEAEAVFRRAAPQARDALVFVRLGQILRATGRTSEAAAEFTRATRVDPDASLGWYVRGLAYLDAGRVEPAATAFRKALKRDPGDLLSRLGLARALRDGPEGPEAAAALLQSLLHDAPRFAPAWFELGEVYARLARPDDAIASFEQAAQLDPQSAKYGERLRQARSER